MVDGEGDSSKPPEPPLDSPLNISSTECKPSCKIGNLKYDEHKIKIHLNSVLM